MIEGRGSRLPPVPGLGVLALLLTGAVLAGCGSSGTSSSSDAGPTTPPTSTPTSTETSQAPVQLPPETLTFGVLGNDDAVAAYRQMASLFAPLNRQVTVEVESWPSASAMIADLRGGTKTPDVFIASRSDLAWLAQHQTFQPVDQLLDDRGVGFGDDYPRSSLTAFGLDNHLACLPYGIAPAVIYYNKRLVHFRHQKVDPPTPGQGWTLDQFAATARTAVREHPGVAGLHIDPTLDGIAPFVLSGGGEVYDGDPPTSLALSGSASQLTLAQTLKAMKAPGLTLTDAQLERRTPFEWFERGKLALLEGSRQLTPALRTKLGFDFDVMPMPSLGSSATVGDLTGLCVSRRAADPGTAADFLVYATSDEALSQVTSAGYLQPANQTAALSDAFQQPGRLPVHASVFTFSVKSMVYPPVLEQGDQLEATVDPLLQRLIRARPARVPALTRQIDQASRAVLGTPDPSSSDSAQPSG